MTNGSSQGLFVVVAVVIFGILVVISYMLFRDTLSPTLASIFKESIFQTDKTIGDASGDLSYEYKSILREDENNGTYYSKIREKDDKKDWTEIWIALEKVSSDNGDFFKIIKSSINDENYDFGNSEMTGDIKIPAYLETTDGIRLPIKEIGEKSFENSKLTGDFYAPSVIYIDASAFKESKFNGYFYAENVEVVHHRSFEESNFKGEVRFPKARFFGTSTFQQSTFTGKFYAPEVEELHINAFYLSEFTGDFEAKKLIRLEYGVFRFSKFNGKFRADSIESIGNNAFLYSTFKGTFNAPKVIEIGYFAFNASSFTELNSPLLTQEKLGSNNPSIYNLLKK